MKFNNNLSLITASLVGPSPLEALSDNRVNSLSNKHKHDFGYFKKLEWERSLQLSYKKRKNGNEE